jgi:hypothetical protein
VFPGRAAQIKIASILCLLGLLLASAVRGRQYVVCLMSGAIHAVACCQRGVPEIGDPPSQGEIDEPACCEARDYPALASGHLTGHPEALGPALPVQAWTPGPTTPVRLAVTLLAPPSRDRTWARAGPGPPRTLRVRLALLGQLLSLTSRSRGEMRPRAPARSALTRRRTRGR